MCVPGRPEDYERADEEELALANTIRDRAWGFYVFVTDYGPQSQALLPTALDKLARCVYLRIQRYTTQGTSQSVVDEVWKRFRLDVIEDSTLSDASLDRVRASFVALPRARRPDFGDRDIDPPRGPKNKACLVLDLEAIQRLADLTVPANYDEMADQMYQDLDHKILKAVDSEWKRPRESYSSYRGWYLTSPVGLHYFFLRVGWTGSHELERMFEMESSH